MKFDYQERIDSYVQGEMTAEERIAFEQEIQKCDELRDQLEYTQKVKKLVSSREEKMKRLRQWEFEDRELERVACAQYRPTGTDDFSAKESACPNYAPAPQTSSKKLWYWVSGIAAILIVGFFVVQPMFIYEDAASPNEQFRGDEDVFAPNDSMCTDSIDNDSIYIITDDCE